MAEALVDVGGARLWTHRSGRGEALLLIGGGPGCCDYLGPVGAWLEADHEVLRFEGRGCGRSDPVGPFDLDTMLRDIEALRIHFGVERWRLLGHSFGADLALACALRHPARVVSLVYLCGHGFHDSRSWRAAYHADREAGDEVEPDYLFPVNREVNRDGNASLTRFSQRRGLWRELAALQTPVDVVVAGRDARPSWPAEQLAELVPNGRLRRLPEAGHSPWLGSAGGIEQLRRALGEILDAAPQ